MAEDEKTTLGQVVVLNNPESPLQLAAEALADTPMVDSEKVRALRRLLAEGTYELDSEQIAQRLLELDQLLPELPGSDEAAPEDPDLSPAPPKPSTR